MIVCDNGTGLVKCGRAGQDFPEYVFPSLIGRPQLKSRVKSSSGKEVELKDVMAGDEAASVREFLEITYPMENGQVRNWKDMEHLWDYTFYDKMDIDCKNSKVLLTEPPMNPKKNRETMFQYMFETYGFQAAQASIQAVLTLYAQGLMTGIVVDSGDGVTHICPVYEGHAQPTAKLDLAGRDITRYLMKLLLVRGYVFNESADFETAKILKEKLSYVAYDYQKEYELAQNTTVLVEKYTLPDGREITIDQERFKCTEALFQPHLVDNDRAGIAEMLYTTIQKQAVDTRPEYYKHIILSGGTTMIRGLPSRLEREIKQLYLTHILKGDISRLDKFKIKVEDPPSRGHSVFLGGAVLSEIYKDRDEWWISREEYQEKGVKRCIAEKCTGVTA